MAKTVKMCDLSRDVAAKVFVLLNSGKASYGTFYNEYVIITDIEPKDLTYPEGWYYAKGRFTNKHHSTTGAYSAITMVKRDVEYWENYAKYCTLNN